MKKSVLALAAICTALTASAAYAGRDELQTRIIRKAIEAKRAAWKNQHGRTTVTVTHPWWHPKFGSNPKS